MESLGNKIEHIIKQTGGEWGIVLEDIDSGRKWVYNENKVFYAASVIKTPIMIAVFAAAENNKFNLSDTIVLKREDMTGGSGVLQKMTPGTLLTIYDLITLMIIQSDNTATNMLIDLVGPKKIQQVMNNIGLSTSQYHHKLMILPFNRKGSNQIVAEEMADMMKKLANGEIISRRACEQMIDILKSQQIQNRLPGKLPNPNSHVIGTSKRWEMAHKTGSVPGVCHDVGIMYVEDRKMIASVLSSGIDDYEAQLAFGEIGWEIYNYLRKK